MSFFNPIIFSKRFICFFFFLFWSFFFFTLIIKSK